MNELNTVEYMPGFERPLSFGYDLAPSELINLKGRLDNKHGAEEKYRRDLSICGLALGTHGRSCKLHHVCGKEVAVGDILKLDYVNVEVRSGVFQERIGVYRKGGETHSCLVGFINPPYYACIEIHSAMKSGLVNIEVIRNWVTDDELADKLYGGGADCKWYVGGKP